MKVLLLLVVLQLCYFLDVADAYCSNGRCNKYELDDDCTECTSSCDCDSKNCNQCAGTDTCCQSCCDNRKRCYGTRCNSQCDCRKMSCSSCSISQNECCDTCCDCKKTKCNKGCGDGCGSVSCSSCQRDSPCCNNCCSRPEVTTTTTTTRRIEPIIQPQSCCSPNITLPNITIIINQSPIYINNTVPVTNQCGNYSAVQGNGTHIVYVYANSSSCPNKTCCRIPWRRPCIPMRVQPYYYCPPRQPTFQCGPACVNPQPPQPQCYPTQTWPYYQCPTAGCYGSGCYQEQSSGCYPVPQWPYYQCPQGMYSGGVMPGEGLAYSNPGYEMAPPPPMPMPYMPMPPSGGGGGPILSEGPGPMGVNIPFQPAPGIGAPLPEGRGPIGVPVPYQPGGNGFIPPSGGGGGYMFLPGQYLRP